MCGGTNKTISSEKKKKNQPRSTYNLIERVRVDVTKNILNPAS